MEILNIYIINFKQTLIMKKLTYLIAIFFLVINLTSCSKDDSSEPQSEIDIISSKSWVIESKIILPSINVGGMEISNIMIIESEDTRNYSFKFNADGKMLQYDSMNNLIFQTTWAFNADKTQINFGEPLIYNYPVVGDMGFSTITIQSLTSSKFVGTVPALYDGTNYVLTITFI